MERVYFRRNLSSATMRGICPSFHARKDIMFLMSRKLKIVTARSIVGKQYRCTMLTEMCRDTDLSEAGCDNSASPVLRRVWPEQSGHSTHLGDLKGA